VLLTRSTVAGILPARPDAPIAQSVQSQTCMRLQPRCYM
jgi:hypothetical protein